MSKHRHRRDVRGSRPTVGGPAQPEAPSSDDALAEKAAGTGDLASALPFNPNKRAEYDPRPPRDATGGLGQARRSDRRLEHRHRSERLGQGRQRRPADRPQPDDCAARPRARRLDRPRADDQSGRAGRRQPELAQGRAARADAARGLHPPREDHALRPRAHSRAHRPRARLGGARLFRVLQAARGVHPRLAVRRSRQADAGVRPLLDRARRARLDRHGARRARLRRQVLHRRRQLGPGRQQHPGVLHPGRDEVPRPGPCREARAALRACRRRARRTTRSGTSPR